MAKKGRHKNRRPSVQLAAVDSGPIKLGASNSSGKNSTSNPNVESLDWKTCTEEERLEKLLRKILYDLYLQALARLIREGYDEDVALNGLLERGYCVGDHDDCLTNVVQNSLQFLTGKDAVESEEQDRPQPFQNLKFLVEFNLQFMVYILQKYRPNMNRISIRRRILTTDLDLNRAIMMDIYDGTFDIGEMLNGLNLDDEDGDKDGFLALEIREMLDNLNVLDDSVSEDMKDAMIANLQKPIDDLKPLLEERIRWAVKKAGEAKRKQTSSKTNDFQLFRQFTKDMFLKKQSELLSLANGLANAEKAIKSLEIEKEKIEAEISALKLIESETKQKCLKGSKKWRMTNMEKETVKLLEEMELKKKMISKWEVLEQQLAENEAAIIQAEVELDEFTKKRKATITEIDKDYLMAIACLDNWKQESDAELDNSIKELDKSIHERSE
ncbi:MND1-interacting protein 1-like [Impatiens glandulifera]|uniref:MND1-interacting protein 1-like n=1 Tax=Impatiens glandulifera TaxID=253017 RepID=UPI001FB0C560|nr:MND1-interacting protein 1-like [Impatiens glandulifera]